MRGCGPLVGAAGDDVVRHPRAGLPAAGPARGRRVETDALHHPTPLGVVEPIVSGLAEVGLLQVNHLVHKGRCDLDRRSLAEQAGVHPDLVDTTTLGCPKPLMREVAGGASYWP